MDPERWHRLSDLFHKALEQEASHRSTFLDQACGDDESLRAEVASLLAYHAQADGSIDTPTHLVGADAAADVMAGRHLGQYVVTRKLGQGGMGVVYLADDTRLGRPVAIKALTREFTHNQQRRERLRREARAVAALSHPAIATVYALEEFEDNLYIVSEYVPGATLRDEVSKGPLPLGPLLSAGVGIARALTDAHEHGVVHRDLKPENVIRTADGGVKVLDFGLARFHHPQRAAATTTPRLTEPGAMLGTPGYMPPEQLRGAGVDFRADIFSFGVLLYELASGIHPFTSANPSSTIARVLEAEPPDVAQLSSSCPPALDPIIRQCLQKDPEQRPQSTRTLLERLEQLQRDVIESEAQPAAPAQPKAAEPARSSGTSALWWWQFHQVVVGLVYYAMLYPLWLVRGWTRGGWGSLMFFGSLAAVGVAANLRFHLWFTSRFYPTELNAQRGHVAAWIRGADSLFVLLLLGAAGTVADAEAGMATLLVAVAIGCFLAFLIIEPATARATFRRRRSKTPGARTKQKPAKQKRTRAV